MRRLAAWLTAKIGGLFRIRFLSSQFSNRIGHFVSEPDCFLKEGFLGLRPPWRAVWLLRAEEAANPCLLELWKEQLTIVTSPPAIRLLAPFAGVEALQFNLSDYLVAINETAPFYEINRRWREERRPPLLKLAEEDRKRGEAVLRELGIPEGDWFACVHARSAGFSPSDDVYHAHRNSPIDNFIPAMKAIEEAGGWCVRVGDTAMERLPELGRVIDYAHSPLKSPFMDMFLCAACRFFVGNTSGLILVADLFGVPTAWSNITPVSALPTCGNVGISKLLYSRDEKRFLKFREILTSPIGDFRLASLYEEANIEVIDNTPDEIRDLALEVLARSEGREFPSTAEDGALQKKFHALFRPGHYAYGSTGRIGRDFLRKHRDLLE